MKDSLRIACFLGALLLPSIVEAQPAHIIMIRHGEKDLDNPKDNGLSLAGRARAAALVPYLSESPHLVPLGKISFVFAQSAPEPSKNSLRPILTVQPFATANPPLTVLTPVERDEYQKLADQLLSDKQYEGKVVLICWEHKVLAEFAAALVANCKVKNAPDAWMWPGDDVYGRTWVLSYTGKEHVEFKDYSQALMFGDTKK